MDNILGIDLGTNSIGWAIRNPNLKNSQIIDYGVLTFDKGVASEKGNEFPKVQKRTESRGKRRNYQSEKYRKWELLEFLIENNMCPLTTEELYKWKKYEKGKKREYPSSDKFVKWLRFDFDGDGSPDFHLFEKNKHESYYVFRAFVLDEKFKSVYETNPHILGRIFYQLVQRRGFRGRDEEEAKTMLEGSEKTGTVGRNEISEYLDKHRILGSALYHYQKENGGRIRQRYNLRKDYENELFEICDFFDFSNKQIAQLKKAIIWQRPLRTQKGLIGNCIYEKNKKRATISHPLYEEYRTWVFINNLKIEAPKGTDKENYLKEKIYPLFYRASPDFELNIILKQLIKDGAVMNANFHPKTKVISVKLLNSFKEILGDNWKEKYCWNNIHIRESKPQKKNVAGFTFEDIWHVLNTFDSQENLRNFGIEKLHLTEEKAIKLSKIKLNQGYATLSLSAIKKIIPYLRKGILYSQAIYLANMYKVLGSKELNESLIDHLSNEVQGIINKTGIKKTENNIVNALIQDELNDENRYSIEVNRNLDSAEYNRITNKIISEIGEQTWNSYSIDRKDEILEYVSSNFKEFLKKSILSKRNIFISQPRLHEEIFLFLKETYGVSEDNKKYIWHPSEQESYIPASEYQIFKSNGKDVYVNESNFKSYIKNNPKAQYQGITLKLLENPEPLSKGFKNPMALKSLYKLKHLLNFLLKEGKIDDETRIVIEIARELNDANKRKATERWINEREKENESFKKLIREINTECETNYDENDKTLLRKIRLWIEQGRKCLYTGKVIKSCDVFNGNDFDLEHTIPASLSFDSELKNLTLADSYFNNHIKGKKFPSQLPNYLEDSNINGKLYQAIKPNVQFIFDKVEVLEKSYDDYKSKASYASNKEIKNSCIQRYHIIKFDLDYWKAKAKSFEITEYKAGWKNSQLRDTQIISKYALPYLKTVFKKVSVEKAEVVNSFKEIYDIKIKGEKKDRRIHSHHAIDGAILTLIPPFYERDKILQRFNDEKDIKSGKIYHEKPKDWLEFSPSKIIFIENDILINNLPDNKTILPTYKKIRKKGKIDYIELTDENGNKSYKMDEEGNKIAKIAQGDTIRGQLHGESFYGAIKQPIRDENNKILFDENHKMILHNNIQLVIRKDLKYKTDPNSPGFKTLEEIEKIIVDKELFNMIKTQVEASDFKTALTNGVYMLDKKGNKINQIRRIRCKESLRYDTAIKIHSHNNKSEKDYKQFTLAKNGENTLCLFYKNDDHKAINILSIGQVASIKFKNDLQYFNDPFYNQLENGKGKNKTTIPLYAILRSGIKVVFYKESIEELKDLSKDDISKRLFKIYQFEGDGRIKFKHHIASGIDTDLKKENPEYSYFNIAENQIFLRLRQANWNFAIDGVDFKIELDGSINWLK